MLSIMSQRLPPTHKNYSNIEQHWSGSEFRVFFLLDWLPYQEPSLLYYLSIASGGEKKKRQTYAFP